MAPPPADPQVETSSGAGLRGQWPLVIASFALLGLLVVAAYDISRRFENISVDHYGRTLQHSVDTAADRLAEVFEEMQKFLSLLSHTGATSQPSDPQARQLVGHVVRLLGDHGIVAGVLEGHGQTVVVPSGSLNDSALNVVRSARGVCPERDGGICLTRIAGRERTLIVATARHRGETGEQPTHVALVADWAAIGGRALRGLRPDEWSQPFLLGQDGAILTWPGGSHAVGGRLGGSDPACAVCHVEREATPVALRPPGISRVHIEHSEYVVVTAVAEAGSGRITVGVAAPSFASVAAVSTVIRNGALVFVATLAVLAFMAWWLRSHGIARLRALADAHGEVRRLNEVLEEKVAARTRALEAMHAHIIESKRELASQDRLAAVGELASVFAHEVRTPLNALSIANQRLQRAVRKSGTLPPELAAEVLGEQAKDVQVINEYVERYLRLARRSVDEAEEVDLGVLVREVFGLLRADAAEVQVRCIARMEGVPGRVHLSRSALRHILVNLITNAIQVQPEGGQVVVSASLVDNKLCLQVADEGPGLDEQQAAKVFEPFTSWRRGGTGLGLSISRRFARQLGGSLTYRPGPHGGAIFALVTDVQSPPEDSA